MKKTIAVIMAVCMILVLASCGKKPKESVITGYRTGDVTLGQYKGITYSPTSTEVDEAEVESRIQEFVDSCAEVTEITDRTDVRDGDILSIDFAGYMDGVAFDGGTASDYPLTIGSGQFIDGFESGLIGVNVGEAVTLHLTFPEVYLNNPDLAGKPVDFDVTVNSISVRNVPELTDELISEKTGMSGIKAYHDYVCSQIASEKQSAADSQKENDVVGKAIENCTFNRDLTAEIEEAKQNLISQYDATCQQYYQTDAKTVFTSLYGLDDAGFDEYMATQAEANIKFGFLASAIAEAEGITATDEETEQLATNMLSNYNCSSVAELYALISSNYNADGKSVVNEQACLNKAIQLIYDSAVVE